MTEDTPPKPKRRRRRWLIACVLSFVVGVTCWWNWPRGDARFVGKWVKQPDISGAPPRELLLWSSGDGNFEYSGGRMRASWRVENGHFYLGKTPSTWAIPYLQWLQGRAKSLFGTTFFVGEKKYEIIEVARDTIRLEGMVLTRIPD